MGGYPIEPGVPPWQQTIAETEKLITFLGDPARVRIRFDPIVYFYEGWSNLSLFPPIASSVAELGVKHIIFSFVHLYPQVKRGLEESGIHLIDPPLAQKLNDVRWMVEKADELGITLHGCCSLTTDGLGRAGCIDGQWLSQLFDVELDMRKDPTQRKACQCIISRDIGSYQQQCYAGCAYCYAQRGGTVGYLRRLGGQSGDING